jgi:hypothetical protein
LSSKGMSLGKAKVTTTLTNFVTDIIIITILLLLQTLVIYFSWCVCN